jgi:hypothetical protein
MSIPVEQFARKERFEYPGKRYQGNYLIIGESLHDLPNNPLEAADDLLNILDNRTPVAAYGLNANPHEIRKKVTRYAVDAIHADDLSFIPSFKGVLKGHDVVWHGGPGQTANYFSELITPTDNLDNEVGVWVQYFSDEQLAKLHASEGQTYGLQMVQVSLDKNVEVNALAYTPLDSTVLLNRNSQMIGIPTVERSHPNLDVISERQALEYTLGSSAVIRAIGTKSLDKYIARVDRFKKQGRLSEQKAIQAEIIAAMRTDGMIADYSYPTDNTGFTRIDFSTYPRGFYGETSKPAQPSVNPPTEV